MRMIQQVTWRLPYTPCGASVLDVRYSGAARVLVHGPDVPKELRAPLCPSFWYAQQQDGSAASGHGSCHAKSVHTGRARSSEAIANACRGKQYGRRRGKHLDSIVEQSIRGQYGEGDEDGGWTTQTLTRFRTSLILHQHPLRWNRRQRWVRWQAGSLATLQKYD